MIRGVALDLDGTLIDSLPALRVTYQSVVKRLELESVAPDFSELSTHSVATSVHLLSDQTHGKVPLAIVDSIYRRELALNQSNVREFSDLNEALALFRSTGMRLVPASNARRAHVQDVISRARWHRVFDAIYTSDDVERPKPPVDMLWRICREFQFDTSELAVIDDSKAFVDAAVAVGFSAAYVIDRNSDGDSDASTRNNSDSLLQLARKIALRAE